jgi:hypothetical protein
MAKNNEIKIELVKNEMECLNHANSGFKITRIINGQTVDIELSSQELENAFRLQEHNYYVMDVETVLEEMEEDDELQNHTAEEIKANEILMNNIVSDYEENREEDNMPWHDAVLAAIKDNITNTEQ